MWRVRQILLRLLNAVRPGRSEPELDREVRAHRALLEDAYRRRGLSTTDARVTARRVLGDGDLIKEQHREARSFDAVDNLRRNVLQSLRLLRHHYRVSVAAIGTVALAVGAVTVVFSVFEAAVLRALPGRGGERLLSVAYAVPGETFRSGFGHLELAEAKRRWTPFDLVGSSTAANLTSMVGPHGNQRVVTSVVSTTYFDLFGARPVLGRPFVEGDSAPDSERVVVLAYALWLDQFGGDPAILGQSVSFDGTPSRVVGVMSADFAMPVRWIQAWLPDVETVQERNYVGFTHQAIARLAPGGRSTGRNGPFLVSPRASHTSSWPECMCLGRRDASRRWANKSRSSPSHFCVTSWSAPLDLPPRSC